MTYTTAQERSTETITHMQAKLEPVHNSELKQGLRPGTKLKLD